MNDKYNIYRGRYKEFIESILEERPLNKRFEHSECHHIIPECLGGTWDDGWVYLTLKEHFIAHKILSEENPECTPLMNALWCMSNFREICTPDEYENIRKEYMSRPTSIELREKLSKSTKANWDNPEYRSKMVQIANTPERNSKLSESLRLYYSSEENRKRTSSSTSRGLLKYYEDPSNLEKHRLAAKISASRPEILEKISMRTKEALKRPEVKERASIARRGTRWMNNGTVNIRVKDHLKAEELLASGYIYGRK